VSRRSDGFPRSGERGYDRSDKALARRISYEYDELVMNPTKRVIDQIFRERVLRARATPPEVKLVEGPRLFEQACRTMRDGIRHQFPDANEAQVEEILRQRLEVQRRLESRE
jgi:hypothetical protein